MPKCMNRPQFQAGRCAFGVFLLLTSIYLLTMSRWWIQLDGPERYALTQSLARGSVSVGLDEQGRPQYEKYGLGQPILMLPFYLSGRMLQAVWDVRFDQAQDFNQPEHFCANLYNQFVTGALCAILFLGLIELGYSARTGFFIAALLGLATGFWPNARWFGNEPTAALLLLLVFYFLLRILRRGEATREWIGLGASGMMAILNNPVVTPLIFLMTGLTVFWLKGEGRGKGRGRALCLALLCAGIAAVMAYNAARYGSVFRTGYEENHGFRAFPQDIYSGKPGFSGPLLVGLYGNLLSSGRSIFIYSPPVLIGVLFFPRFWRRNRRAAALAAAASLFYLLVYSKWWCWYGGGCWGNRMLLPVVPLVMCAAAEGWERCARSWPMRAAFYVTSAVGMFVQALAVVVFYGVLFHAFVGPTFQGEFMVHFVPTFSPLAGQVALLATKGLANHDLFLLATLREMPLFSLCVVLPALGMGISGAAILRRSLRSPDGEG